MPPKSFVQRHVVEMLGQFRQIRSEKRVPLDAFVKSYCKAHKSSCLSSRLP